MCVVSVHHRQGNWPCCPTSIYPNVIPNLTLALGLPDLDCYLEAGCQCSTRFPRMP